MGIIEMVQAAGMSRLVKSQVEPQRTQGLESKPQINKSHVARNTAALPSTSSRIRIETRQNLLLN